MKYHFHPDIIHPPALSKTKILGLPASLMDIFFQHRIFSDDAREVVYREAENAFRNKLDDSDGITGIWQGEFWGKWIISAVRVAEYSGDIGLREFIRHGVHNLLKEQEPDGYLGTYRDRLKVYPVSPLGLGKLPKEKQWCRWNWNLWCRKYTLWGLLEAYRLLGEPEILAAAERFTRQLIAMLHEHHIRIADTGMFAGLPSCSILKPVLLLYGETGHKEYLDFALEIAAGWEEQNGRIPNLITNAACPLPLHEWYQEGCSWTKVYELLSCLDGLLELYRCTGTQKFFDTVKNLYDRIRQFDLNHMFSVGFNDQLAGAAKYTNALSEPCDTIHWMRVASELFRLTGNSAYMDDFELAYCNAFLASVNRSGRWGARAVRSHGHHFYAREQAGFIHNHCCVNNIPRGFMNAAAVAAMYGNAGIFINLYFPFEAELPPGRVAISGNYPAQCRAEVEINLKAPTRVHFRIPIWSKATRIVHNDIIHRPPPGAFFSLAVAGTAHFTLEFDREVRIRELEYHRGSPEAELWWRRKFVANENPVTGLDPIAPVEKNVCTLQYGPLLLARSKYIGNTEAEMFDSDSVFGGRAACGLTPCERPEVNYAFTADFMVGERRFQTSVCDYASAANEIIDDPCFFSIFF